MHAAANHNFQSRIAVKATILMKGCAGAARGDCSACALQVVLPEGSTDIKASLPLPAHPADQSFDKKHSYLDTLGRPVLVLRKQNVVPDQNLPLDVTYRFSGLAMLQEPLLLVSAFFAVFCMLILYGRCEFSLSPHAKQA